MDTAVNIKLWNQDVAAIAWDKNRDIGVIEFYQDFPKYGWNISPLMMNLEDINRGERIFAFPNLRSKTFKGLPGMIADALPDDYGNSVIDEWFVAKGQIVDITPLDRLCYIGKRSMGAFEFEPANSDELLNESSKIEINELIHFAQAVLEKRTTFRTILNNNQESLIDILRVGTSAGGAKPKAIIAFNEKTKEIRSGQVKAPEGFGYWILKFDGMEGGQIKDNPIGIGRIEYTYYQMACDCGINITSSKLLEDGLQAHFMTQRFDRTQRGEKIMMQTLCGIAHYDRDDRYGYEQLFNVMRRLGLEYPDFEQQYRRMVFNVVSRNHDDHTKNHSFIMSNQGVWSLAPAYDLCYTYSPSGQWTNKHQMSINGKRDGFVIQDLLKIGQDQGINHPKRIIEQITDILNKWSDYAKNNNVIPSHISQIKENLRLTL